MCPSPATCTRGTTAGIGLYVPADLDDARAVIKGANVVIGARMHACLNALSTGTPGDRDGVLPQVPAPDGGARLAARGVPGRFGRCRPPRSCARSKRLDSTSRAGAAMERGQQLLAPAGRPPAGDAMSVLREGVARRRSPATPAPGCGLCPRLDGGLEMRLDAGGLPAPRRGRRPAGRVPGAAAAFDAACPGVRVSAQNPAARSGTRCSARPSASGTPGRPTPRSATPAAAAVR